MKRTTRRKTRKTTTGSLGPGALAGRVEAICFDLDETLVDSAVAWRNGFTDAFASEAVPRYPAFLSVADLYTELQSFLRAEVHARGGQWANVVIRDALRKFFRAFAEPDNACADRTFEAYTAAWPRHISLFPDALAALQAARGHARLAVITNGSSRDQRLKLERTGLLGHFEVIAISEEVGAHKPAARIFAHTLSSLGIRPDAALHIGDNLHMDVGGARAAGLTAVWLNRHGAPRTPGDAEPHHEVPNLQALVPLLT